MIKKNIKYIKIVIISIAILFGLYIFSFSKEHKDYNIQKTFVNGNSMLPNFYNGEIICLYNNYYKKYDDIQNGDVIGFTLKTKGDFIKRVIAIPGDKVIFGKDGYIYINDKKYKENYVKSQIKFNVNNIKSLLIQLENYKYIVPNHMYMVMGDNRLNSIDSSIYGLIDFEQILGKVYKSKKGICY